jgi:UDP:flavonoid glycosyltransferase YjiC (YdhE family)
LSGTPTIFATDGRNSTDGELWRAKAAASGGFGLHVEDVTSPVLERAVRQILDPTMARQIRTAAVAVHPGNGADDAVRLIVHFTSGGVLGR